MYSAINVPSDPSYLWSLKRLETLWATLEILVACGNDRVLLECSYDELSVGIDSITADCPCWEDTVSSILQQLRLMLWDHTELWRFQVKPWHPDDNPHWHHGFSKFAKNAKWCLGQAISLNSSLVDWSSCWISATRSVPTSSDEVVYTMRNCLKSEFDNVSHVLCIMILSSADQLGEAAWSEEEAPGVLLASDMIFRTSKFRLK
jgi:hypothetical protein